MRIARNPARALEGRIRAAEEQSRAPRIDSLQLSGMCWLRAATRRSRGAHWSAGAGILDPRTRCKGDDQVRFAIAPLRSWSVNGWALSNPERMKAPRLDRDWPLSSAFGPLAESLAHGEGRGINIR